MWVSTVKEPATDKTDALMLVYGKGFLSRFLYPCHLLDESVRRGFVS